MRPASDSRAPRVRHIEQLSYSCCIVMVLYRIRGITRWCEPDDWHLRLHRRRHTVARQRASVPAAGREIDRGGGNEEGANSGGETQIWDSEIVQEAPEEKLKHLAVDSGHTKSNC
jgi:hypothetical protein